ncbi:MAG: phosphopantothenoylcysteine decarboxylase domain-containing protein [Planctomycetota bacterium]
MRILITAGPTREPLDPVRFLSNYSTGEMGFALARRGLARGHEVLLVLGPVEGQPPVGAEVYAVETAGEMRGAVLEFLPSVDAILCAAAVADFRPARPSRRKLKRGSLTSLELVESPDIAAEVGRLRQDRPFAIFALETEEGPARARGKLARKDADLCVVNGAEAIGAEAALFTLVRRDGSTAELGRLTKDQLAETVYDELGL